NAGIPSTSLRAGFAGCSEAILASHARPGRPRDSRRDGGATKNIGARASVPLVRNERIFLARLCAGGGCQGPGRLGWLLGLRLRVLFAFAADLNSALERGAVFHADAHGGNVAVDCAFGADIHAIAALDVAIHFAHDHDFAGLNAGVDLAVAADGDSALGHGDFAFDAAVDVESLGAADFALDDQRAADGGLIHRSGDSLDWVVRVEVGSR